MTRRGREKQTEKQMDTDRQTKRVTDQIVDHEEKEGETHFDCVRLVEHWRDHTPVVHEQVVV